MLYMLMNKGIILLHEAFGLWEQDESLLRYCYHHCTQPIENKIYVHYNIILFSFSNCL
jgi:hypothetical protein